MKRNSYADLGLVVAVAVFVIVLVKSLIFGLSWASLPCFVFTLAYFGMSLRCKSDGAVMKHATTVYLVLMLLLVVSVVLFDKNARPKMHAFEGAAVDTLVEEEFVVEDRDIPVEIIVPDTLDADTLDADTLAPSVPSDDAVPAAEDNAAEGTENTDNNI